MAEGPAWIYQMTGEIMQKKRLFASFAVTALVAGSLVATSSVATAATRNVTVWAPYSGANLEMWNTAIKRVEASNPGLKVTSVGSIDMAKSLAAINAGNGPDISVSNGNGNLGWFCGSGAWQKLNVLIAGKNGIDIRSTFNASANASAESNHNRCALPLGSEVFAFYSNKDLLAKAGFTRPPKTTTELLEYSKKLTTFNADGSIKTAGFLPWAGYYGFDMDAMWLGQMFGAKWYGGDQSAAFASDARWAKAFNWQKSFIASVYGGGNFDAGSKLLLKFVASKGGEWGTEHDFMTGRVAMKWDANWMGPMFCTGDDWAMAEKCTAKYEFTISGFPVSPELLAKYSGSGVVGQAQMGISKGSKNVKDAWIVMKALATDTKLASAWDAANGAPSSLLSKDARPAKYPSWYQPIYDVVEHPMSAYHIVKNTGEHQEEALVQNLMASWQAGDTPNLKSALAELANKVNQIVARNN
jgi:multiple sugar transport system substrate-binding protein